MNLKPVELKTFLPATDFALSQAFYKALGFSIPWQDENLAYVHLEHTAFLLQKVSTPEFAHQFQMHLLVEDVDAWHAHVSKQDIAGQFGVAMGALCQQPWRMRDFTLTDPSGVLWRIAQNTD